MNSADFTHFLLSLSVLQNLIKKISGKKLANLLERLPEDFWEDEQLNAALVTFGSIPANTTDLPSDFMNQLAAHIESIEIKDISNFTVLGDNKIKELLGDYLAIILGVYALLLKAAWENPTFITKKTDDENGNHSDEQRKNSADFAFRQALASWFKNYSKITLLINALPIKAVWKNSAYNASKNGDEKVSLSREQNKYGADFAFTKALAQSFVSWFKDHAMMPLLINALPMPALVVVVQDDTLMIAHANAACRERFAAFFVNQNDEALVEKKRLLFELFPEQDKLSALITKVQEQSFWKFIGSDCLLTVLAKHNESAQYLLSLAKLPWGSGNAYLLLLSEPFRAEQRNDLVNLLFKSSPVAVEIRMQMPNKRYQRISVSPTFIEWFPYLAADDSPALNKLSVFKEYSHTQLMQRADLFILETNNNRMEPNQFSDNNDWRPVKQILPIKSTDNSEYKLFKPENFALPRLPRLSALSCFRYDIKKLEFLNNRFQIHWLQDVTSEWLYKMEQEADLKFTSDIVKSVLATNHKVSGLELISRPLNGVIGGDFYWARYLDDKRHCCVIVLGDFPEHSISAALMTAMAGMTLDGILEELPKEAKSVEPEYIRDKLKTKLQAILNRNRDTLDADTGKNSNLFISRIESKLDLAVIVLVRNNQVIKLNYTQSGISLFHITEKETKSLVTLTESRTSTKFLNDASANDEWKLSFQKGEIWLADVDKLLLSTDGLIKQRIMSKDAIEANNYISYGSDSLLSILENHYFRRLPEHKEQRSLLSSIMQDWDNKRGKFPQGDDVLVIEISPFNAG